MRLPIKIAVLGIASGMLLFILQGCSDRSVNPTSAMQKPDYSGFGVPETTSSSGGTNCIMEVASQEFLDNLNEFIYSGFGQIVENSCHRIVLSMSYGGQNTLYEINNEGSDPCMATFSITVNGVLDDIETDNICGGSGGSNTQDDAYEPDDQSYNATMISADYATQSHTLTQDDEDWYYFNVDSGYYYVIETSGNLDTYINLYDSNISFLASNDDGGMDLNARVTWYCSHSGTYYFSVRGIGSSETGGYSIWVERTIYGY
jgi:hypothetical protein